MICKPHKLTFSSQQDINNLSDVETGKYELTLKWKSITHKKKENKKGGTGATRC